MTEDFSDFSSGPGEGLEGLEDRDFELSVDEIEEQSSTEYLGPCGGCSECSAGSRALGANLDNIEAELDIVEVSFKAGRSGFFVNVSGSPLPKGTRVIVEAERGVDLGRVTVTGEMAKSKRRSRGLVGQPMRKALRTATQEELKKHEENREIETNAIALFREKSAKHNLEMKLVGVEYQHDRSRITFFFTADSRVDFRSLVRDLASVYKTRIELRQIGARDEAKKVGGVGVCGMKVCCSTWMTQIKRVTLDHARFQNLSLNPSRLAGTCGRLKCCILFEAQQYLDDLEDFPPLNSKVVTKKGEGYIEKVDILRDQVFLRYPGTSTLDTFSLKEMKSFSSPNH